MKRRDGDFKEVPDMEDANFSTVYPLFPPEQEPEFQAGLPLTVSCWQCSAAPGEGKLISLNIKRCGQTRKTSMWLQLGDRLQSSYCDWTFEISEHLENFLVTAGNKTSLNLGDKSWRQFTEIFKTSQISNKLNDMLIKTIFDILGNIFISLLAKN